MSFAFCVLGSGSRGNSTLLAFDDGRAERFALIDCGLSPRATAKRLAPLGVTLDRIDDILLTHLDTDHFYAGWVKPVQRFGITVHVHKRHRNILVRRGVDGRHMEIFECAFTLDGVAAVEPVPFAHDSLGTVGFVIERQGARLGFATDLGRVPAALFDRFTALHALAIESNYDRQMQIDSSRPMFLKRRIMNGRGHLSNDESLGAVRRIAGQSELAHVVPLHLSQQCNDPQIVKRLYAKRAPELLDALTLSNQHEPTPTLTVQQVTGAERSSAARRNEQMVIF
jgi:phosphoribosyl 1,2-cyclic phosphodiesterase